MVVSALGALMTVDVLRAETLPSAASTLDEAIDLVAPLGKIGDAESLLEIAMRQTKIRSCEKAKDLFRTSIDLNEKWAKEQADNLRMEAHIGFLSRVVAVQRGAGCFEEMTYTAERLRALYQQRNQKRRGGSADDKLPVAFYKLELELDLGSLYLAMGDSESASALLPSILSEVRTADWSPRLEFQSAAVLLARMDHTAEALEIIHLHEKFYDARPDSAEDLAKKFFWIRRVAMLAEVAEAQAEAGHREASRATLRQAIEKVRRMPVTRLTEVYGEKQIPVEGKPGFHKMGEGKALQSAGIMRIVFHAATIGETDLALEAFELASPLANQTDATGILIQVLARKGEVMAAHKLLDRFQCSSKAIAQGLLDKQDWAGAIQADEAYQKSSCCKRECNFGYISITDLGQARTFVEGPARALEWARRQPRGRQVYALLGVVDALLTLSHPPVR